VGEVISLSELRDARDARCNSAPVEAVRVEFYFDLSCPFAYLAAERVERSFADVIWRPACATALNRGADTEPLAVNRLRRAAEQRATVLRMPLEWPDNFPGDVPGAMRAAAYAAEQGRGGAFALAAGRLAFCGGFDLDDPEILAEAAAAAGIGLEETLQAARDASRDGQIEANGRRLLAAGADRLPVLRHGRSLVWGEERIGEVAVAARARAVAALGV
jgi:2-hydroxychromene-2-carboxylate isomerase